MKAVLGYIWQYFKKMDKQLFLVCVILGLFSCLLIYSIIQNGVVDNISTKAHIKQFLGMAMGAAAALVLSALDYRQLAKLWFLYAPACLILSLLLFTPLGGGRSGADDLNWLNLGFTSIQPSEFLKVAFLLSFSYHISLVKETLNRPLTMLALLFHAAVPAGIVAIQGDYGTAIVFGMMTVVMLFSAGISWKYIAGAIVLAVPTGLILWFKVLQSVHKDRIKALFNPDAYPELTYQTNYGKIALGSGQMFGKGLFGGEYSYVPEAHNDFIFSYVGQTCGFVGCMLLVGALTYICVKLIANSRIAKDELGKMICVGTFAIIFTHSVLNLGMVLGVLPVIGIPLPFTSNGGTAMLSMFLAIGLVMSTYSHSGRNYAVFYDAD